MKFFLNGQWSLSFLDPKSGCPVTDTATVPGNIEPELQRLGLLTDYMPADDKFATADFDLTDYTLSTIFDAPACPAEHCQYLVFEGLDTIATVTLNGETILQSANMHRTYRIPLAGKLRTVGNTLCVTLHSAELWARHRESEVFAMQRPGSLYEGNVHLRKARYAWGWDHAPRLRTVGIFRDVYIETLPNERFTDVYLFTQSITDTKARLGFRWDYTLPDTIIMRNYTLRYTLLYKEKEVFSAKEPAYFPRGVLHFSVPLDKIGLWWPVGYGKPELCVFRLEMLRDDQVVATKESNWGIRTVRLYESEALNENGTGEFRFVVNNLEIFARGTNWKPLDPLPSRANTKLPRALSLLTDLHCNMVRIWGGGYYEGHEFFDYCDTHGILVWQDFMFACEVPTRDDTYCEEAKQEAREIIKQLRNHPSLAVWCGDNENDQNFTWAHGDGTALPSDQRISREILRNAVIENDPYRSYVASSPRMPDCVIEEKRRGIAKHLPLEKHLYTHDSFEGGKTLREAGALFLGEAGPNATPPAAIYTDIYEREHPRMERLWNTELTPGMRCTDIHQDDSYFIRWRQVGARVVKDWFNCEFDVTHWREFALALNIACANVYKDTVEFCRTSRPQKTGVLWWSLLDMWPMLFNFSVVDSNFRPKLPYYWLKQSQQSNALIVSRKEPDGVPSLYVCNETLTVQKGRYRITAVTDEQQEYVLCQGTYTAAENTVSRLASPTESSRPELWLIEWEENGQIGKNHFITGNRPYKLDIYCRWLDRIDNFYGVPKTYDT